MEYRRFADTWVVRMDRGEEIVGQLQALASREQIRLAEVTALGAVGEFTVGVYHPSERQYASNTFTGDFEIVSLTGTVTEMDGRAYLHLHMSAGDGQGRVFGGHLNRAVVSATCELIVRCLDGHVGRRPDPGIGLNLFAFD